MATFVKRGDSFLQHILRGPFPYLLIVEKAAILVVAYLVFVGATHFRVEGVAAAAATATLALSFVRHVADSRNQAGQARDQHAASDPPGNALSRENGGQGKDVEDYDVKVAVAVVVTTKHPHHRER